ncbi:Hypothetical predicted protein [Pelobates cultripes]|uniref:Uncharacterized protein n=1 Tax=Pelobates cultripes TaxID=61616 RepID=A0AAD1WAU4_PELCU|nr:Hypothetical predicted protein [Pelobates cultripes]
MAATFRAKFYTVCQKFGEQLGEKNLPLTTHQHAPLCVRPRRSTKAAIPQVRLTGTSARLKKQQRGNRHLKQTCRAQAMAPKPHVTGPKTSLNPKETPKSVWDTPEGSTFPNTHHVPSQQQLLTTAGIGGTSTEQNLHALGPVPAADQQKGAGGYQCTPRPQAVPAKGRSRMNPQSGIPETKTCTHGGYNMVI